MLEKENQECHCTENCACKNQSEEHNKTATSCGCDSQSVLDKIMEYEDSCNCGCKSDCTDESCNCCEEEWIWIWRDTELGMKVNVGAG